MSETRQPVPPGTVSSIQGRRQGPALRAAAALALVAAAAGLLLPDELGDALAVTSVVVVSATPLLRVTWLIFRWSEERDWRFVVLGVALLGVVGLGALLALAGVGGD